jgi:ribosome biogenesis GTPase / thiamine phosphate phosphatase
LLEGTVFKAAGGFFSVRDENGKEYRCRARGMLKRGKAALMVGDRVLFEPNLSADQELGDGMIEKLLPRTNLLQRPPVANVDQLAVVMALKHPDCDWQLVSRMLVLAEKEKLSAFVCLNKKDLVPEDERLALSGQIEHYPYPVLCTSALSGDGIEDITAKLRGVCSVFAGPSGVGKSTLLNAIQPGLFLKTGSISNKIKRGRHTTRQAELLALESGGTVVDTPGFTRLDFTGIEPGQLAAYFPEFDTLRGDCSFRNCMHITEPGCAVRREVGKSVNTMRYGHYAYFIEELG